MLDNCRSIQLGLRFSRLSERTSNGLRDESYEVPFLLPLLGMSMGLNPRRAISHF
jgi:hypothetical protein